MLQIVVPMAGAGRRFADAGYKLPKPLIPVSSSPMVVRAVGDLPLYDRLVFVCHSDHVREYRIDRQLQQYFPSCRVVVSDGLTAGQACTVRLAAPELLADHPVLVAACDNTHMYDADRFEQLIQSQRHDALIWTYRSDTRVLRNPCAYGWVEVGLNGDATRVSVKVPISDHPLDDHAVTGCFWFKRADQMIHAIDTMVAAGHRVHSEYYLDSVPNILIDQGRSVGIFEVKKYIGWGTPAELEDYRRFERYITSHRRSAPRKAA